MTKIFLSFCIGVYNEEGILKSNLAKIKKGLSKITNDSYEIIVVENGSTDQTKKILNKIKDKKIRIFFSPEKGLGMALRLAILKSKGDIVGLNAIDLPFGFWDLEQALKLMPAYDMILGSKAHPKSRVNKTLKRRITSYLHNSLLRLLFNVNIRDTQGSIYFKKNRVQPILALCRAKDSFFHAQLVIYSQLLGLKITEVPVNLKRELRPSKYSVYKEGIKTIKLMIREYKTYKKIRTNNFLKLKK